MFEIIDLDKLKGAPADLEGVIHQEGLAKELDSEREISSVSFSLKQLTHKLSKLGYEKDFID